MASTAFVLKNRDMSADTYPVSRETNERIQSARVRQYSFEVRRVLEEGGFGAAEVDSIVEILMPFLRTGKPPVYNELVGALVKRNFSKADAEVLGRALARSK